MLLYICMKVKLMLKYCNAMASTASVASGASNASRYPSSLLLEKNLDDWHHLHTNNATIYLQEIAPAVPNSRHRLCSLQGLRRHLCSVIPGIC